MELIIFYALPSTTDESRESWVLKGRLGRHEVTEFGQIELTSEIYILLGLLQLSPLLGKLSLRSETLLRAIERFLG